MEDQDLPPFDSADEGESGELTLAGEGITWSPAPKLQSKRDQLHEHLDRCWPEIAWKVRHADTAERVPEAFRFVRHVSDPVIRLLTTKLDQVATAQARDFLSRMKTELKARKLQHSSGEIGKQNTCLLSLLEKMRECSALQVGAEVFLKSHMLVPDRNFRSTLRSLEIELGCLRVEHSALAANHDNTKHFLFVVGVYFTHQEFLMLRKRFTTLTPRILANGLAGLPFMGSRTSTDECRKFEPKTDGLQFEIFKRLEQLATRYKREMEKGDDLASIVAKWIRKLPKDVSAVSHLRDNQAMLIRAVQQVDRRASLSPDALPYAIARHFAFLQRHRSAEQVMRDEIKRLVLRSVAVREKVRKNKC